MAVASFGGFVIWRQIYSRNVFRFWVLLCSLVSLILLVGVTGFVLMQSRAVTDERIANESIATLAFQVEREYLRLRHSFQLISIISDRKNEHDWLDLVQRYEVLVSRVLLLREMPGNSLIKDMPEYQRLMSGLNELFAWLDSRMQKSSMPHSFVTESLLRLDQLSLAVQDFSFSVNRQVLRQSENQQVLALRLERWVIGFSSALGVTSILAAIALLEWQRKQRLTQENLSQLNQELALARDEAIAGSQAKSRFVANMSHELRTPFNGVLGALQLLDSRNLPESDQELLTTARNSAEHLLQLLNDVLDLSALDEGKLVLHYQPLNMKDLVLSVVSMLRPMALDKGLELRVISDAPEVASWVLADATRIRQVLINLLGNAIKFTENGSVSLHLRALAIAPMQWKWHIKVHDTGPGVSPDMVSRLFKRFEQADESTTRRHEGIGLGLEISRALARSMGGDLIYIAQNQGACFEFSLTLENSAASPLSVSTSTKKTKVYEQDAMSSGMFKVLVVEDHPVNARLLTQQLTQLGYESVWVKNGQLALDQVLEQHFDLILMDIHMPVMDGLQATRCIRSMSNVKVAAIPIIAVTADILGDARDRYFQAGMNGVLEKPYRKEDLAACLAEVK